MPPLLRAPTVCSEHHEAAHRNLISTLESLLYVEDAGASSPHIPGLHAMQSTVGMIINGKCFPPRDASALV